MTRIDKLYAMSLAVVNDTAIAHALTDGSPCPTAIVLNDLIVHHATQMSVGGIVVTTDMHFMAVLTQSLDLCLHLFADAAGFLESVVCQEKDFHSILIIFGKYTENIWNNQIFSVFLHADETYLLPDGLYFLLRRRAARNCCHCKRTGQGVRRNHCYRKVLPQTLWYSDIYARSSFPSEKRESLENELIQGHYDVIVGDHAPLAVRLASCIKKLQGVKTVGWIHNSYEALFGKNSLYIGPELRKHYEFQLAKLDKTIVLCQYDAKKYSFPTQVIYNPLTLKPGKPSAGNSKKFLAVGRFSHRHKGFDLLIDAFHLFAQRDREWTLDIVGEGPEEELYRKKIAEYGLERRVTLHPFTNNIQQFYSNAQVYVLSSRWEGFGLVLVEAMAHGLPVVSSDLPTSKEIMGEFGMYFENGNTGQLAEQLEKSTQTDWETVSSEAIQRAKLFSVSTIIRQWKELIEQ